MAEFEEMTKGQPCSPAMIENEIRDVLSTVGIPGWQPSGAAKGDP
jgi:hypothetical protein